MTDRLLPYYHKELSYIRRLLDEFSERQPDAAARLGVHRGQTNDPHVNRLVDAFAYLTARIRLKLDDEFPELTDALLGVLYPHYLAPIPSAAIAQFVLDPSQGELTTGYTIARGTGVEVYDPGGVACRFRTCYDTTLWPIEVAACELQLPPFSGPAGGPDVKAIVHARLRCLSPNVKFGGFDPQRFRSLRFFLSGEDHHAMPLYELLLNHCVQVVVATSPSDTAPRVLPPDAVQPVGFAAHERLLPYDARSLPGYGLLTDYFAFPHKFLFVDLFDLGSHPAAKTAGQLDVYFCLGRLTPESNRLLPELKQYVHAGTLCLGAAPIVNLFSKRAEPIKLTHKVAEYPVIPDARQRRELEVFSVDRVTTSSTEGVTREFRPLYACPRQGEADVQTLFWQSHRRLSRDKSGRAVNGTDVSLSLVDVDFRPSDPPNCTLLVETTCLNRDLPGEINRPQARLLEGAPIRSQIECLVRPTATGRPSDKQRRMWSLVSHLLLGHLSINDVVDGRPDGNGNNGGSKAGQGSQGGQGGQGSQGGEALRRILELYDFSQSPVVQKRIGGVAGVQARPAVCRLPTSPTGFARGVDVTVDFDEEAFRDPGQGLYLFASVLEAFLSTYGSINSFSRMTARIKQGQRVIKQWPPNPGDKFLL